MIFFNDRDAWTTRIMTVRRASDKVDRSHFSFLIINAGSGISQTDLVVVITHLFKYQNQICF
jgi:hypothetical protein